MQTLKRVIPRLNTSETVATVLRHMIVDGQLPAGERINEVHLAGELGVSRTPLREALARLAHEGALESIPRIGHFVRPLTVEELEQVYSIRPLLEPEALRIGGIPSRDQIENLRKLNRLIGSSNDPDDIISADDEWHISLIAHCPNDILVDLVKQFIRRTRRYEIALMRERKNVAVAAATHESILQQLELGNLDAACAALLDNLESGREPIVAWLRGRNATA